VTNASKAVGRIRYRLVSCSFDRAAAIGIDCLDSDGSSVHLEQWLRFGSGSVRAEGQAHETEGDAHDSGETETEIQDD
jgi:hypothetical protein